MNEFQVRNEKRLWQAVVINAIRDAFTKTSTNTNKYNIIQDARSWLTTDNCNYFIVCFMAGVEGQLIREKVKSALAAENFPKRISILTDKTIENIDDDYI